MSMMMPNGSQQASTNTPPKMKAKLLKVTSAAVQNKMFPGTTPAAVMPSAVTPKTVMSKSGPDVADVHAMGIMGGKVRRLSRPKYKSAL